MKTIKLTVKGKDTRNEMHFEVQRRNRAQVHKNKKAYDRKSFRLEDYQD